MKDVFSNLSSEKRKKELKTDNKTFAELVDSFVEEERTINTVLKANSKKIAQASEVFFDVFTKGGRIFFIGAGTSGRLGILDAAECPPTFGGRGPAPTTTTRNHSSSFEHHDGHWLKCRNARRWACHAGLRSSPPPPS